jgi:hypothetical protein
MVLNILLTPKERDNIFQLLLNLMEEIKCWFDFYAGTNVEITKEELLAKN